MKNFEHDIYSFNELGLDEQLHIARKKADLLETVEDDIYKIDLYSYFDFFIEVVYRKELNIIKGIKGIDADEYADKYIELEDMEEF